MSFILWDTRNDRTFTIKNAKEILGTSVKCLRALLAF